MPGKHSYGIGWNPVAPDQRRNKDAVVAAWDAFARYDRVPLTEHATPEACEIADMPGLPLLGPGYIKARNPSAQVYRTYVLCVMPVFDQPERRQFPISLEEVVQNDWWLRDPAGRIVADRGGQCIVDVGKGGLARRFVQECLGRTALKGFRGFVFDYWHWNLMSDQVPEEKRLPHYATDELWQQNAWIPFISYVCQELHSVGCKVIGNCVVHRSTEIQQLMRSLVDGAIYERFTQNWDGSLVGVAELRYWMDLIATDPLEAWVSDGRDPADPLFAQRRLLSLAAFYMAVPATSKKHFWNFVRPGGAFWDPLFDLDIGEPSEAAVKRSGVDFWSRKFTRGVVLLNWTARTSTYTAPTGWRFADGGPETKRLSIPPYSGVIRYRA